MSEVYRPEDPLSVEAHRRVDAACLRFEAVWKAGQRPILGDYLAGVTGAERRLLLRELLLLDVHYRLRNGVEPTVEDYLAQLPHDGPLLREFFSSGGLNQLSTTGPGTFVAQTEPGRAGQPSNLLQPPGYQILGELGRGAMGVVYKAWQVDLKRVVALKMILSGEYSRPEQVARFRTEAQAIARLEHPFIVQVHQVGEHRGQPFCVLEYVEGGTLARKLSGGLPAPREAADLLEKVAQAVHAMHQCRVMHRDLKPGNVLLTADGSPKITDFGLAKILDEDETQTQSGDRLGTPPYMAPEQAEGRSADVGPWTDVYAVGVMLYECLTGRPPFVGTSKRAIYRQISNSDPVPPRKRKPAVPRDLETICLKCLEKDPARRYASAQALADDLRRYLEGLPIQARPVRPWEQVIQLARRRPLQTALAGAVAVTVLAVALVGVSYGLYKEAQNQILQRDREVREQVTARLAQAREACANGQRFLAQKGGDEEAEKQIARAADHVQAARELLRQRNCPVLGGEIESLESQVGQAQKQLQGRRAFREGRRRFLDGRERVLLHAVSVTGRDEAANRQQILLRAREALAHLGVNPDRSPAEAAQVLSASFEEFASAAQLRELALGCYEVLQVWAEAEARVPPGRPQKEGVAGARRALGLMDVAEALAQRHRLGVSKGHQDRRKRYLKAANPLGQPGGDGSPAHVTGQPTALDLFLDGLKAFGKGQPREAAAACEEVLRQDLDHFWAWYVRTLCHFQLGEWRAAKLGLTACLKARPDFLWARLFRATAHSELGEADLAERDFAEVLAGAEDPALRYLALTNRSVHWLRSEKVEEWALAEDDLTEAIAIKLRPESYKAYVNLAWLHRRRGQRDQALAAISSAIERHPERNAAKGDLQTSGEIAGLYLTRARLNAPGDRKAARADFLKVIAAGSRAAGAARLASACVELAQLEFQDKDYDAVLTLCEAALEARPGYPPAHRQRAHVLLIRGDYKRAGEEFDLYLLENRKTGTSDPGALRARGHVHVLQRQFGEAVVAYTEALAHGADADTLFRRGSAYLALNSPERALADFQSALVVNPDLADARRGQAEARLRLGQITLAAAEVEAVTKAHKGDPESCLWAARFYGRAVRSLQAQPGNSQAAQTQADRFRERAIDLLREALAGFPPEKRKQFWRESVQGSADLAPLRGSDRFLALADRYGKR